ncbi:TetR/AcrR family transcriptional regulator [Candidatus Formimonas warabiya]|uniref:TetR family transcriptional regulator n=1 Tax=Formimonas warabiya TaxID=1761012 RepID=A0A3G1KME1_FORW1|nr:TetR/AcrR family transcriptional regulator [Candidatus Formimonas warabiya]ATW23589.1 TetR family transcriptional regulator [Candidatus Formimonas warabiya]
MEKFFSLPVVKQNKIIDAALKVFGTNGYKKASVSDIANAAGISKAMVFHYFGSKKALYLYLIEFCGNLFMKEVDEKLDNTVTDFFDRIKMITGIEISLMKRHPAILSFLTSIYFENHEEVQADIKAILAKGEDFRNKIAFEGMDTSKFRANIDVKLVMKILSWIADGYAAQASKNPEADYDALFQELNNCLVLLKNNFYKDEYL